MDMATSASVRIEAGEQREHHRERQGGERHREQPPQQQLFDALGIRLEAVHVSPRGVRSWCASERLWRCEKSRALQRVHHRLPDARVQPRVKHQHGLMCELCDEAERRITRERLHAGVR